MEKAEGLEPHGGRDQENFDEMMDEVKKEKGYKSDTDLTVDELKHLVVLQAESKGCAGSSVPRRSL